MRSESSKTSLSLPEMSPVNICLLQVLVTALLLVSCAAFVKRYPDPLDATKYYLRIDNALYHLTYPSRLILDVYIEQCTVNPKPNEDPPLPDMAFLEHIIDCNQNTQWPGYFCPSSSSFTYCTHDGLTITDNGICPSGTFCKESSKVCV
jgi:hypothetical protein